MQRTLGAAAALIAAAGFAGGYLAYRAAEPRRTVPVAVAPSHNSPGSAAPAPAAAAAAADESGSAAANRPVPRTLPDIRLPDLAGHPHSLRDYLGRPLIVNFWATWCAPCRREMPLLSQLQAESGDRLRIVGIAIDFRAAVDRFLRQRSVGYPILVGEDQGLAAAEKFGMEPVLPFSVFADAQGRIVTVKVGELHRDEAGAILDVMRALASGSETLPQAQQRIAARMQRLAIARAQPPAAAAR